jgi:hypothetical protein
MGVDRLAGEVDGNNAPQQNLVPVKTVEKCIIFSFSVSDLTQS